MPEIIFSPEEHTYTVGGRKRDHVTGILRDAGVTDDRWFTPEARDRGSAVHKCIELHEAGTLDPDSIDPRIQAYFDAYLEAKRLLKFKVIHSEIRVYEPALEVAGTVDLIVWLNVQRWLIDCKTGAPSPGDRLQTALYMMAWNAWRPTEPVHGRAALRLLPTGRPSWQTFDDQMDFYYAGCAVGMARFRRAEKGRGP